MSEFTIGSLFSGTGGLDMAITEVTGARTAWVSDIDKGACKILAHRYPDIPNHGDLTQIDWAAVEPVDIITGGFPCQDLSTAGKRAGMASGTRSGLWSYMCDAINIIRPRLVVAENVRGLLSAEALRPVEPCPWCVGDEPSLDLRALGAVLADLADIGYDASWYGLRAADVGACHGRWRCFVVAYPASERWAGRVESWPVMKHNGSQPAHAGQDGRVALLGTPQARDYKGVPGDGFNTSSLPRDVSLLPTPDTGESPNGHGRRGGKSGNGHQSGASLDHAVTLLPTPAVNDMGAGKEVADWDAWTDKMKAAHGNGNRHGASLSIEALRLLPTPMADEARKAVTGQSAAHREAGGHQVWLTNVAHDLASAPSRFGQYADAVARWETAIGRPAPSPTEPTGKGGAARLSADFTTWMMGLPDGWITDVPGITRNEALKACGNGVVPQQAAAALRLLLPTIEVAA